MKVNTNQEPAGGETSRKKARPDKDTKPSQGMTQDGGNIYKDSIKGYIDKWKGQLADGGPFTKNKTWIVLIVALFVIFLSINSRAANARTQLIMQTRKAAAETDKLNAAIEEVEAELEEQRRINDVKLSEEQEELARNDAVEQGTTVANLQNTYQGLDSSANYEIFNNNKNRLDACFSDDDKNARVPWLSGAVNGTWEFASRASFTGNTARVLWLCHGTEDGMLLAYCTATYHADTKLFSDVEWKLTGYAQSMIPADGETSSERTQSFVDMLDEIASDGNMQPTGQVSDEKTMMENGMIHDAREAYKESVASGNVPGEEYDHSYDIGLGTSQEQEGGQSQ